MSKNSVATGAPLVNPERDETLQAMRLANAVIWACMPESRRSMYAGQTWADFKQAIERLGVTDSTVLGSIDFGNTKYGTGYVLVDEDESGAVAVREMR
jgi:hypothetical protein